MAPEKVTEHGAMASAAVSGYQLVCSCDWESLVVPGALDQFDIWAEHVESTERTR